MSLVFVGQAVTSVNGFPAGTPFDLVPDTAEGDMLSIAVFTTGDLLPVLPEGWAPRYGVNKNAAASLISNIVRGYIKRGASAPPNTLSGYAGSPHVTVVVKAYRPTTGVATFVGEAIVDLSGLFGTSHSWAGFSSLKPNDVLDMAVSSGRGQSFGDADAVTDPSTASGPEITTGMPAAGSWRRRASASAPVASLTWFSACGVKELDGATGNFLLTTDTNGGPLGSVLVFRDVVSAGPTPIAFDGPIPALEFDAGEEVDVDLSGFWTGSLTPFSWASAGASFAALGLALDPDTCHLEGTAVVGDVEGCRIEGNDAADNAALSNLFRITVNAPPATELVISLEGAPDATGLDFAVWASPRLKDLSAAPLVKGATAAVVAEVCTLDIAGLGITVGQVVRASVDNSDGSATQNPLRGFSGPVVAS